MEVIEATYQFDRKLKEHIKQMTLKRMKVREKIRKRCEERLASLV